MRNVFGLVLIVGLGLAGFAVYMVQDYMASYEAALQRERANRPVAVETVNVFVAAQELRYGEELTAESVRQVAWPRTALPEGVFTDQAALFPEGSPNRYVMRAMDPNEAIMAVKVTEPGEKAGLTQRLEPGKRAYAIRVDRYSGVSGFLRPDDKVDVYWTGRVDGARGEITKLIETGVRLIAVDQRATVEGAEAMVATTVTVAVNSQQVASLAQAQKTGDLSLALVGYDDTTVAEAIEVDQRILLGIPELTIEDPVEAEEDKTCSVRTRRGSEVVVIQIPCTN